MKRFRSPLAASLIFLSVCFGLGLCLFLDTTPVESSRFLGPIAAEILATFRDPNTQWIVYACCGVYFFTFQLLGKGEMKDTEGQRDTRFHPSFVNLLSPDVWLCSWVTWVTIRYAFDYEIASRNTHALTLIAGAALGKGVGIWVRWSRAEPGGGDGEQANAKGRLPSIESGRLSEESPSVDASAMKGEGHADRQSAIRNRTWPDPVTLVIGCLLLLLAAAALWQPDSGTLFHYRGQRRWQGPWDNPNVYGLLMGVGLVLAVGLLVQHLPFRIRAAAIRGGVRAGNLEPQVWRAKSHRPGGTVVWGWAAGFLVFVAAGLCGFGLLKSYSRGAWLGVAVALMYLLWRIGQRHTRRIEESGHAVGSVSLISWVSRNRIPLLVIFIASVVVAFWELRHTDQPFVRRVFTVGNRNDFSWRNRVTAWEGALAMMAERPLTGVGWSRPEALYDRFYRPVKVDDGTAIQLNHYFTVGMSAGLPALGLFLGYLGLALLQTGESRADIKRRRKMEATVQRDQVRGLPTGACSGGTSVSDFAAAASDLGWVCKAGGIVLLVGLWFDGGLFHLATAGPLWILLELGRVAPVTPAVPIENRSTAPETPPADCGWGTRRNESLRLSAALPLGVWASTLVIGVLGTGLLWAHARDPFRRLEFSLKPPGVPRTTAMAVMPKHGSPFPVVVYVHGSGGDVVRDGEELQQLAQLGLAAVSFDFDKTNQAHFDLQMKALTSELSARDWARRNATGWITKSLGAQRTLGFMLKHPQQVPQVIVRLSGGGEEEDSEVKVKTSETVRLWLIHGEDDEVFPAAAVRRLAEAFKAQGMPVRFTLVPGLGHGFGADQPLVVQAAAEFCAEQLGAGPSLQVNLPPPLIGYWIPISVLLLIAAWLRLQRWAAKGIQPSRAVRIASIVAAGAAAMDSALHLALPLLPITDQTVTWAERFLVRPQLRESFRWLAAHNQVSQPREHAVDRVPNLRVLLEHVELASLQRELAEWAVADDVWRQWVLSPRIEGAAQDTRWRRVLWEQFYPRVRAETRPAAATDRVVRHLALRVCVMDETAARTSIREMWSRGVTDLVGFEQLYVAALRSVGVPARLADDGCAHVWDGEKWRAAPRPFSEGLAQEK